MTIPIKAKGSDSVMGMNERLEYEVLTYEQLSAEFRNLWPYVNRAKELIALMYNRLTLIDGFTHKAATAKILNDHKQFRGFSRSSLYRALPETNPNVPHRIVSKWDNRQDSEVKEVNCGDALQLSSSMKATNEPTSVVPNTSDLDARISEYKAKVAKLHRESCYLSGYSDAMTNLMPVLFPELIWGEDFAEDPSDGTRIPLAPRKSIDERLREI